MNDIENPNDVVRWLRTRENYGAVMETLGLALGLGEWDTAKAAHALARLASFEVATDWHEVALNFAPDVAAVPK